MEENREDLRKIHEILVGKTLDLIYSSVIRY